MDGTEELRGPRPAVVTDGAGGLPDWRELPRRGRGLSLRTLVILRWMSILGQGMTILIAYLGLNFNLPVIPCAATVLAAVAMNLHATRRLNMGDVGFPDGPMTARHLGFDIIQISVLLALTGGLQNPFSILLIAPVTVAAASLPARQAVFVGLLVVVATVSLYYVSLPLPWRFGGEIVLPALYRLGVAMALLTGVVFTSVYAWRVAADAEKLELALATTQDVLQREQRLAALGGLAAAAAHELGTPLATIQVVAKELQRASAKDGPAAEDAALILAQAERCREILKKLSQEPEGEDVFAAVSLRTLLEEVVSPHRGFDLDFQVEIRNSGDPLQRVRRLPEIIHGLSTLIENAADFAASTVKVTARISSGFIEIEVLDDGPGFAADILPRLGEPYVTSRPQGKQRRALAAQIADTATAAGHVASHAVSAVTHLPGRKSEPKAAAKSTEPPHAVPTQGGMGLGFFIARTLLERTAGRVTVGPGDGKKGENKGARVVVRWPRSALEALA